MVCKENVVSWFGNLSSYKRIDIMCTLLNMCLPFEVRYLGTCVEDLGKRDYNDLRDTEHRANNVSDLAELTNLGVTDKRTRRKLALYMALLHSCNYSCAVILYKNLSNVDFQEIVNLLNGTTFTQDDQPLEELLLLYTMALNHPAFTYEQKSVFGNIYVRLQEEEARLNPPKPIVNSSYKNAQGCTPCVTPNDRTIDSEIPANCLMPPPQMPNYHGEMPMRTNTMVSGVPPGLTMQPPPGLCLPSPEQLPVGSGTAPYFTLGFPSVNHMPPWAGQVMMGNQAMYHIGDVLAHPPSPLVSRQSSPSQSRSPSRSNSPMGRRNNTMPRTTSQITQSDSNTLTTSTSSSGSQTSMTSSSNNTSLQQLPSLASGRNHSNQQAPLLPSRTVPPPAIGSSTSSSHVTHSRDNSIDNAASPPANASNLKQQQPPPPPRLRSSTSADSLRETLGKEMPNFKGNLQNYSLEEEQQPFVHHHHNHNTNVRRYPTIPPMEPSQMQMYPAPPPVYAAHNTPCYACLTMSVPGVQNRYPRCNAPHVYCVTQLQALRLDAEGSRHCSQSSSSESTGSRSPPETPPAMPWVGGGAGDSSVPPPTDHLGAGTPLHSTVTSVSHPPPSVPQQMQQQQQQQQQQPHPERQRTSRRNPAHVVRQKNQMVNGGGPPSLAHCVSFSAPPNHTPVTYLPHGHFQALRPSTGLYSNFSHAAATAAYARPGYPTSYQPNGEIMFQYPTGQPGSGGTPPPPPTAAAPAQTYLPPAPVVTYSPAVQSAKISCYNCGSSSHHASDCKDQTMEDLTKRAQYRLDYTIMKQPGECPSSDK